jgi:5-methylcytosine-specific restriction protein A
VFHLIALDQGALAPSPENVSAESLDHLREKAYAAAVAATQAAVKDAKRTLYQRSAAVHDYVLARAAGTCECCRGRAPFVRRDGSPYLEPHHTRRISDRGPDHPRWVGAACPNCHREIHFGADGDARNQRLQEYISQLESALGSSEASRAS